MDAINVVLTDLADIRSPSIIGTYSDPIPSDLRQALSKLRTDAVSIRDIGTLDTQLGTLFANAIIRLLKSCGKKSAEICAIGSHGQTVFHAPNQQDPFTMQLGDPNIIAERTGITTISDFRRRDVAAGGQGAPLVPAFHEAWLGQQEQNFVVLNLGGIANISVLESVKDPRSATGNPTFGFDTGPANTLLDAWSRIHLKKNFDANGEWAKSGKPNNPLLKTLLKHPYFRQSPPKSTGPELFNTDWLGNFLKLHANISPEDVIATLVELTVESIQHAIDTWAPHTDVVVACGGGCNNNYLIERLASRLDLITLKISSDFGIDTDWVEAVAFAWLAKQHIEDKPGNLPSVTGARGPRILGGTYHA